MSGRACRCWLAEAQRISQFVGRGNTLERQSAAAATQARQRSEVQSARQARRRCTRQHPSIAPSLRWRLLPPFQANQQRRGSGASFVEAASIQRLERSEPSISGATLPSFDALIACAAPLRCVSSDWPHMDGAVLLPQGFHSFEKLPVAVLEP